MPTQMKTRLPYREYLSADNICIRVGRSDRENDELSCNPIYREDDFWWMHVDGMPGSHIVICSTLDDLCTTHKQTILDAAFLAALNSKADHSRTVPVHLTRCYNVSKANNSKPGLVQLSDSRMNSVSICVQKHKNTLIIQT